MKIALSVFLLLVILISGCEKQSETALKNNARENRTEDRKTEPEKPKNDEDRLFWAIDKDDVKTVMEIINRNPDLAQSARDGEDRCPLKFAADKGKVQAGRLLREKGASFPFKEAHYMKTLKDWDEQQIIKFITLGADVNIRIEDEDPDGMRRNMEKEFSNNDIYTVYLRPLHYASRNGSLDMVKILVENGADINAPIEKGEFKRFSPDSLNDVINPYDHAPFLPTREAYRFGWAPIHLAAASGHTHVVRYLLESGVDVDYKNANGWTPLSLAVALGQKDTTQFLLEKGADINAKGKPELTPLEIAVFCRQAGTAELLLKAGADVNTKNRFGTTVLSCAINRKYTEIADLLRKYGGEE